MTTVDPLVILATFQAAPRPNNIIPLVKYFINKLKPHDPIRHKNKHQAS